MAIVFVLRAFQLDASALGEARLTSLPIRIGRNALADFQIRHGFLSDFHALIEDIAGRLYVRDLNSKNGVYAQVPGQRLPTRVPAQSPIDLASAGFQFFLSAHIRVSIEFEQATGAPLSTRASNVTGSVLGNQAMLFGSGGDLRGPPQQAARPSSNPAPYAPPGQSSQPPRLASPSRPPGAWDPNLRLRLPSSSDQPVAAPLPALPAGLSGAQDPSALPPLWSAGFEAVPVASRRAPDASEQGLAHTGLLNLSLEAMALQGLRELAGSLVPNQTLTTTGDLARFITKLHDTIEVFCRSFIPLREGYTQFVSSLDLQRAAMQRSNMRSPAYLAVESAREPAGVAAALLDWRERSMDAPKAIEGIFADLMIHQVALLDGVMQGVRGLLEQLSPESIEQQTGPQGGFALDRNKARYKALWETYSARYQELAEEKQAFAHIFGPQFTDAYRDYRKQRE